LAQAELHAGETTSSALSFNPMISLTLSSLSAGTREEPISIAIAL